jgi:hypothetical protein
MVLNNTSWRISETPCVAAQINDEPKERVAKSE